MSQENNKKVVCINKACLNKVGHKELFLGKQELFSTLCTDENEFFKRYRTNECVIVKTDTLTNILSKNKFPKDFSLLLIDAEGMDYEILLGLDFNLFQPRIIMTEEYKWNIQKHNKKCQLLKDKGYVLYKLIKCNAIWLRSAL